MAPTSDQINLRILLKTALIQRLLESISQEL
jgi:hypothetical protein